MSKIKSNATSVNKVLIYGGGLDSTVLAFDLMQQCEKEGSKLTLVHVNYSQKAVDAERSKLYRILYDFPGTEGVHLSVDLSFSRASIMKGTAVGGVAADNRLELRNPLIATLIASYCSTTMEGPVELYFGFHQEPADLPFPDAGTQWLIPFQQSLNLATNATTFNIYAPYSGRTRQWILETGLRLQPNLLDYVHTCYEAVPCGICIHCKQLASMVEARETQND